MCSSRLARLIASVATVLFILAYFPGVAQTAGAPAVEWVKQFGTGAADGAIAVAVDGSGSVYVAGTTGGLLGPSSAGGSDAFLRKYTPAGEAIWTRQFGLAQYDGVETIGLDGAGNVYVVGRTSGLVAGGQIDAFIYKYDGSGAQQWYQQFGTISDEYVMGAAVDSAGNTYVTGSTFGTFNIPGYTRAGNRREAFLVKYAADGAQVWARQFGLSLSDVDPNAVAVDSGGGVYVVGETQGALDGPAPIGAGDAFIRKYEASGALAWTRQFGTTFKDNARSVATGPAGTVLVTGFTNGTFAGETSQGEADIYIRKYDGTTGADLWTRQSGAALGDYPLGIAVDSYGGIYVAGSRWGSGVPMIPVDAFVRAYDNGASFLWEHLMTTPYIEQAYGVAVGGGIYVAGYTAGILGQSSSGGEDAFLVKLSEIPVTPIPGATPSPAPTPTPVPTPTPGPTLTPTPSALLGDINLDGIVNILDLTVVAGSFNKKSGQPGFLTGADINGDGIVDIFDLVIVGRNFSGG
ncbi:MAG: SBBP repeat-containing protein [Chloroflexi bacterium]|nr:SBBP repeat-containing protein [Chloroflexota bacterium]